MFFCWDNDKRCFILYLKHSMRGKQETVLYDFTYILCDIHNWINRPWEIISTTKYNQKCKIPFHYFILVVTQQYFIGGQKGVSTIIILDLQRHDFYRTPLTERSRINLTHIFVLTDKVKGRLLGNICTLFKAHRVRRRVKWLMLVSEHDTVLQFALCY